MPRNQAVADQDPWWIANYRGRGPHQRYGHHNQAKTQRTVGFFIRHMGLEPGQAILDLCCAFGRHTHEFTRRGFNRAVGVDLSPDMLAHAASSATADGRRSRFVRADIRALPFRNASADEPSTQEHPLPFRILGHPARHREPPPSTRTPSRQVSVIGDPHIVLVRNEKLNSKLANGHAAALQQALPGFSLSTADSLQEVCTALTERDLELVEFYCHGKGDPTGHWLEVGSGDQLHPDQLATWDIADWAPPAGPERHWEATTPLIILNGCHTLELTPQSPVNFVDAFSAVHASGVIGTEITTHQSLAGEVTERILSHFAPGHIGMGEAVRRMRHDLLAKGNLLGLAYTAYCSADLRLVHLR